MERKRSYTKTQTVITFDRDRHTDVEFVCNSKTCVRKIHSSFNITFSVLITDVTVYTEPSFVNITFLCTFTDLIISSSSHIVVTLSFHVLPRKTYKYIHINLSGTKHTNRVFYHLFEFFFSPQSLCLPPNSLRPNSRHLLHSSHIPSGCLPHLCKRVSHGKTPAFV